jgi:hypothetical protein
MTNPRYRAAFSTEAEAHAFIQGVEYAVEYADIDYIRAEGPDIELDNEGNNEYVVYVEEIY